MENRILELLRANDSLRPGEIAEKLGVEKKEIDKAIKKLKEEDKIFSPKRCFYAAK